MKLDPETYHCTRHGNREYLTRAVHDEVETATYLPMEQAPPEAMGRFFIAAALASSGPFKVLVNCPGENGTGDPHPLVFDGTWRE